MESDLVPFAHTPIPHLKQFTLVNQTPQIKALMTILRNKDTPRRDFVFYSDRLFRILMEEGLAHLPFSEEIVETPTGAKYTGLKFESKICGVSIIRAGESMENALRQICPHCRIGKILIQRSEDGLAIPKLFYTKVPKDISTRQVLLLDPMLATGGSAIVAIEELIKLGVPENRILFLNLLATPEGVDTVLSRFPSMRVCSICLDERLNEQKYIIPGLGDFGDRYFGTDY
ncbi:putative Uracil phosphoribosyltransferase [Blattamonas nauphoetae]|uniref:Uracil phosphoribosyltransferase n=1 Tax=Blattamonas nauphoetae TaxID=2049346 RepID=A0ABQ9YC21_9EUKA|nr:putative Uracil phosphoribosyltransferase [Blattamonas nauphoetae]